MENETRSWMNAVNLEKYFTNVEKEETHETHVWMGPKRGKKFLPEKHRDQFYAAYNQSLFYASASLHIAEKPRKLSADSTKIYVPLVVDIDLNCPLTMGDSDLRLYSDEDAVQVIQCFHRVFENCLHQPKKEVFWCFLLEKPARASDDKWKNGFHLHFPFSHFSVKNIREIIFTAVKIEMDSFCYADGRRLFGLAKPSVTLDSNTPTLPWLMYGSKKSADSDPYLYTKIFDRDMQQISLEQVVAAETFVDVEGQVMNFSGCEKHALIRLLSIDTVFVSRTSLKTKPNFKKNTQLAVRALSYGPYSSSEDIADLNVTRMQQVVALLSAERASSYWSWWNVMITIVNVSGGSVEGKEAWIAFSQKAGDKYDEEATLKNWDEAVKKPRHASLRTRQFGSLVHWALEDDAEALETLRQSWKSSDLRLTQTDWKIAMHFFDKHKDKYVFHEKTWYQNNGIIWEPLTDPLTRMRSDIVALASAWRAKDVEHDETSNKNFLKLVKKLEGPEQSQILNQATTVFEIPDFGTLLDSSPHIIAFQNGIYDMAMSEFRKASPYTDYLRRQLPIPYVRFELDDPRVAKMLDFFVKLFPQEDLRDYFMSEMSEIFWGGNRDKIAMFWIGKGNNGKSVLQILIEKMIGNLGTKLSTSVLTSKRTQQGNATPEIAGLRGRIWAMMEELNPSEEIESGTLKHFTGNDTLTARNLYGNPFEFQPRFKLAIAANSFPNFKSPDEATWDRVRVIPFMSCFVNADQAPATLEEQMRLKRFPKNPNITAEFPEMAVVLAWYLLELFKEREELRRTRPGWTRPVPACVIEHKIEYKKRCNRILQFADQMMLLCSEEEREKNFDVTYTLFKEWWFQNVNRTAPTRFDFVAEMTRLGNIENVFYKLKPVML